MTTAAREEPASTPAGSSVAEAYRRYGPALVRKAERILQSPDDASDIVQALFVDLMTRDAGRDGRDIELRYLYRAVTNRCLNHLRDGKNRRRLLEIQTPALRGPVRTRVEDRIIGLEVLVELVRQLDARSAEILICRYWDDMTQDEIAALLGVSRKTVGKRLARITARVTELLARNGDPS